MGVRCTLLPIFLAFLSTGVPSLGRGATSTSTRSVAASLPASPSAPVAEPAAGVSPGLRVYLDCDDCDILYFQKEIGFVDFVRERAVADVHTLVTNQSTGGGGDEITLTFIGRRAFVGIDDTLRVFTQPAESDQQVDSHIAQRMRLGLVRYLARTPDAELLRVERDTKSAKKAAAETPVHDPWNGWIFSIDLKGFFEGESGRRSIETSSRISVSRVTSRDKWRFDVETSYDEDRYDYEDYQSFSARRGQSFTGRYVFPVRQHWAGAMFAEVMHSTYQNIDFRTRISPAIEYNIFPYSESTRRQLRLDYYLRFAHSEYLELTVYEKMEENTIQQALDIVLDSKEPWGSSLLRGELSNYFHDASRNRVSIYGELELNLFKGLSLELEGQYERIRDLIELAADDPTPEEILLQRQQLETEYYYYVQIGLEYTFGSIFNPAVNARFGDD